jgi:hypothetical protein
MITGRSNRTPAKHYLLSAAVGKVCGVLSLNSNKVPCRSSSLSPFICVDLCGGDGLKNDNHDASPRILYHHCNRLRERGKHAELTVIEKQVNTFGDLKSNCSDMIDSGFVDFINADARDYRLPMLSKDQAAFIHCDPNNVDQTPLTSDFVRGFNPFTTYLVTLGCNVGGLKRIAANERSSWFYYVDILVNSLPRHHDALLFWLNNDSAQWAYLLSFPKVWAGDFLASSVKATSKLWDKGVSGLSYRNQRLDFNDRVKRLFLTGEEYGNQ